MVAYVVIILQYVILCYSVVNSNSLASGSAQHTTGHTLRLKARHGSRCMWRIKFEILGRQRVQFHMASITFPIVIRVLTYFVICLFTAEEYI
jgi:hypothetical protein